MGKKTGYVFQCMMCCVLCFCLFLSNIHATDYKGAFCSYYDYSEACYDHWIKVETKVWAFVEKMSDALALQSPILALERYRSMDTQLDEAQWYYEWTQRTYLIGYLRDWLVPHMHAVEEDVLSVVIPESRIQLVTQSSMNTEEFLTIVRRDIISWLIDSWFSWFIQKPYKEKDTSWLLIADQSTDSVFMTQDIWSLDVLDQRLRKQYDVLSLQELKKDELRIPPSVYRERANQVYLFKTQWDLAALWYTLVSHRERTNTDEAYRRENISTSFDQIGHVRVMNPGDEISFLEDSNFDPYQQQLYQNGFVIFLDEEKKDYGGGLCWWSTAIYQWIVTNKSLSRPALRNHSKRYHYLYDATIDGESIITPGIDSTIYSSSLDLRLKNTSSHPIILVLNYEWWSGEQEEVFTVGYASDRWSISYVSSRPYYTSLSTKWGWSRSVTGKCYTWNINGENRESCYKEVKK